MARGRFLEKDISLNEKVDKLSDDTARLLYTWLIPHLDYEGKMYADPIVFRSIVVPRRNISLKKIEKYLKEFEKCGLIFRYFVENNCYLICKNFEKHQPGLRKDRESESQIPPVPADFKAKTASSTPDLIRNNSGVTPAQVKVKVKDKVKDKDKTHTLSDKSDREGESSHVEDKAPRKRKPTLQEQRFNLFWEEYPKKIGKQAALKRWLKLKPDPQLFDKIIQAVKEQRGSHQWTKDPKGEFIPGPARWLNEGRWDDVLPTASPGRPFQSRNTPVRDNRWWPSEDSREPGPDYEVPTLRVGKEKRADYDTRMPRLEEDTEPPEEDSP